MIVQKILALLATIALFYFNIDALTTTLGLRFHFREHNLPGPLPNHWTFRTLFRVYDVFDRWSNYNYGYEAYGTTKILESVPEKPTGEMINLDIYKYFPMIRGEASRKILLFTSRAHSKDPYPKLSSIIKRLHNKDNPDAQIVQVFIYRYEWPKSPEGYKHLYDQSKIFFEESS